jgi:exodeoxyribonuclease VII small subunit
MQNIGYNKAIKELEKIMEEVESDELDVDKLAQKIKKASELLKICKDKLTNTEQEVNEILNSLE